MTISQSDLLLKLTDLVRRTPNLRSGPLDAELNAWLGSATALVEAAGDVMDTVSIKVAAQSLNTIIRDQNAHTIETIVRHTLARLELQSPSPAYAGTQLAVGQPFSNLAAIGDVLAFAGQDVFIVDPYADGTLLAKYVGFAHEGVRVRVLGDAKNKQPTLQPALTDWIKQYGTRRPLSVRLSAKGALHNRDIIVDGREVWRVGQSLKDIAIRSPDTLEKMAAPLVAAEVFHYESVWSTATELVP
jgi:hypothetical protein